MAAQHLPLDVDDFLDRYWQREPLLLCGALPGFVPPISADELAGLAMEAEFESRLIEENGGRWQLTHGPFTEADYARQPPWTLLVQAVDHHVPEVAALRRLVNFIPGWRGDDIMVSYATDGGSVGPHFDYYDVFLLQGEGERLWRLGQRCDHTSRLVPGCDMRVLRDFDCSAEYLLKPGDMLYVPPGVAHWGIAKGACTTFSIGFRAPRVQDLLARLTDQALEQASSEQLFSDPKRETSTLPGEISPRDLERARAQAIALLEASPDPQWFGELLTEPRYPTEPEPVEAGTITKLLRGERALLFDPAARLAWQEHNGALQVFSNGSCFTTTTDLRDYMVTLCETGRLEIQSAAPENTTLEELLEFLLETGGCYVEGID